MYGGAAGQVAMGRRLMAESPPLRSDDTLSREILANRPQHPALSPEGMKTLREGLATCRSKRGLTPEANAAIVSLCRDARANGWTAEQLLMAVKDACYSSPEISHLTTTSERDAFLAKIVTACIREFYRDDAAGDGKTDGRAEKNLKA